MCGKERPFLNMGDVVAVYADKNYPIREEK